MLDKYIIKNGKKLRYGFTTGSCASAAARAATKMLINNEQVENIKISTPSDVELDIKVIDVQITKEYVTCGVIKDSGDDPDITNGVKVYATVRKIKGREIKVLGGRGVGVVTKKGLSVQVGKAAINPVPMKMIKDNVRCELPSNQGLEVVIEIPEGEEIAKKTFNPRLGIVGGISVIGTSGLVEPMSEEALKDSLVLELSMARASGMDKLVFVPGNYGNDFATKLNIKDKYIVKTSNFIGFMIDNAKSLGFKKILMIGHAGKMVKVAGGNFQTHSKFSDSRMEILAAHCACLENCTRDVIKKILECITTDEAVEIINESNLCEVFDDIASRICEKVTQRAFHEVDFETIIFSNEYGMLGKSKNAMLSMEEFIYE